MGDDSYEATQWRMGQANLRTPPASMDALKACPFCSDAVNVLEDIIVLIENSEPYNAQDVARALLTRLKEPSQ